jgi:hypothetical protein
MSSGFLIMCSCPNLLYFQIGKASDIWSLGISILDLLSYTEMFKKYENEDKYIIEAYKEGARDHKWIRNLQQFEKRNKLLNTLSHKMIAQNRPDAFKGIVPLLKELDGKFPHSMQIIRVKKIPAFLDQFNFHVFSRIA